MHSKRSKRLIQIVELTRAGSMRSSARCLPVIMLAHASFRVGLHEKLPRVFDVLLSFLLFLPGFGSIFLLPALFLNAGLRDQFGLASWLAVASFVGLFLLGFLIRKRPALAMIVVPIGGVWLGWAVARIAFYGPSLLQVASILYWTGVVGAAYLVFRFRRQLLESRSRMTHSRSNG